MRTGTLRRVCCLLAVLALLLTAAACGGPTPAPMPTESTAVSDVPPSADTAALTDAAAYILHTVPEPQCGPVGGEWAVIGLARSGCGSGGF